MKIPFTEPCSQCGGYVEVEKATDLIMLYLDDADIADATECTRCGARGLIDIDNAGVKFVNLELVRRLDRLTRDIFNRLHGVTSVSIEMEKFGR